MANLQTAIFPQSGQVSENRRAGVCGLITASGKVLLCLFCSILLLGACDRSKPLIEKPPSDQANNVHLVNTTASPKSQLDNAIRRYRSLSSYQDQGYVRLAYIAKGQAIEDRAPMNVAWDSGGNIGLRVYSVVAGPTKSGRWHLSLGKTYSDLTNQVLSRKLPKQVDLAWLLSEPLVSESLSAGLGGFPPQLDLLLSPQPLSRLADNAAKLTLLEPQLIDGVRCSIVSLTRHDLTYVFWIDQRTGLFRRLELPTELLPTDILSDTSISKLQLSIEFADASVNPAINWTHYQSNYDADKLYVNRFIPPPPQLDLRLLGEQIPAFRLTSPNGEVAFDSTSTPERKASVLIWLADHPACLAAAEQMQLTKQQLSQAGISEAQVEYVPIWAESQPPDGITFEQLHRQWKLPGTLALDRSAAGRDLFQVQEAPTVAILDGRGRLQFIDVRLNPTLDRALAPLVSRVVEGIDVAAELKQSQRFAEVRYRTQLAQAAASDAPESQRNNGQEYPPESLQLSPSGSQDFSARIIALAQDMQQTIWVLQSNGNLQGLDATLRKVHEYSTQWTEVNSTSARLLPSPDGKLFALSLPGSIEVFDARSQQAVRHSMPDKADVIDMQWLTLAANQSMRLAAITSAKQVVLLDPENRQQHSGSCPSDPMAILAQPNRGDLDGMVALANRALEPLKLSQQDGSASASPVAHLLPDPSQKISFDPSPGPWQSSRSKDADQTLATGWLAEEELALFFLDEKLQSFWHYRLPFDQPLVGKHRIASAISPANGATVWAVLDATNTIHLLRGDVMWSDHFRPAGRVSGIALVPAGDRLVLLVASQATISAYELK